MRLGPAEEIYAKEPDRDADSLSLNRPETQASSRVTPAGLADERTPAGRAGAKYPAPYPAMYSDEQDSPTATHPAEMLPMTSQESIAQIPRHAVIDTVIASATLRSRVVETEESAEYQKLIENLQRELRYKAYRKGATAVIQFKIELTSLTMPSHYRVLATGVAIRADHPNPFESPDSEVDSPIPMNEPSADDPNPEVPVGRA